MAQPFAITNQRLATIWPQVTVFWDELLLKYEGKKYPVEKYADGCKGFRNPGTVSCQQVESLLRWKYGKTEKQGISPKFKLAIEPALSAWPDYVELLPTTVESAQDFWDKVYRKRAFVSRCFLVHLAFPSLIPLADVHAWRALRYLHEKMGDETRFPEAPSTWGQAALLQSLEIGIRERKGGTTTLREVDKLLMMLGKHIVPRRHSSKAA